MYGFNFWFVISPLLLVLVALVSGLRHRRHHCRPLKDRYSDELPTVVGALATLLVAVCVIVESRDGLLQLADSGLTAQDSPAWSPVVAAIIFSSAVLLYVILVAVAIRLGDICGRFLVKHRCEVCRRQCQRSLSVAQTCPVRNCSKPCPAGVDFIKVSLDYAPEIIMALASQVEADGMLDVPYVIRVNHPRGKVAYSSLLPDGSLRPLATDRRPYPRREWHPIPDEFFTDPAPTDDSAPESTTDDEPNQSAPSDHQTACLASDSASRVLYTETGLVREETSDGHRLVALSAKRSVVTNDPAHESFFEGLRELG